MNPPNEWNITSDDTCSESYAGFLAAKGQTFVASASFVKEVDGLNRTIVFAVLRDNETEALFCKVVSSSNGSSYAATAELVQELAPVAAQTLGGLYGVQMPEKIQVWVSSDTWEEVVYTS